jgi:cell wall-associated NlpC family hydrolase
MSYKNLLCKICFVALIALFATDTNFAQGRVRVVQPQTSQETEDVQPIIETESAEPIATTQSITTASKVKSFPQSPNVQKRTTLAQPIVIVNQTKPQPNISVVKPTVVNNQEPKNYSDSQSLNSINKKVLQSIQAKIGIPYVYGSQGPNSYDCSGLVWSVFQSAGVPFERGSAKSFWQNFETVTDNDKYKFGTLVFFNGLGHVGIVADENGFYHASSSKGVTYSPFAGYWEKRIVGFRRIPVNAN